MAHLISLRCFWKRQDIWEGLIILICIKSCFQDKNCKKRYIKCKKKDYNIWTMEGGDDIPTTYIPIWQMIKTIVKPSVEHWSCVRIGWKMITFGDSGWRHSLSENEMPKFFAVLVNNCSFLFTKNIKKISKSRHRYLQNNT